MSIATHKEAYIASDSEILEPTNDQIAALAHQLWEDRGCPIGSPEEDWFQAETELKTQQRASIATV